MIRKRSRRAGLERRVVAASGRIESVDRSQDRIGISTVPNRLGIDIRDHEFVIAVPVALRQEAQHLRRLGFARCACLSDTFRQRLTFDKSTMLHGGREEGRAVDLLPEVEARAIPVLPDVIEIVRDDWPDGRIDPVAIVPAFGQEPLRVSDQCCRSQRRSVPLRSTPGSCEGGEINLELRLAQTGAVGQVSRWAGYCLEGCLGGYVFFDDGLERSVAVDEHINQHLEC